MRKTIVSLTGIASLAMLFNACQVEDLGNRVTGEVDFTISTSVPSEIVTYAEGDATSHMGGATALSDTEYDLRYILEIYDDGELVHRLVTYADNFNSEPGVTFTSRLLAKVYTFVFWADYVPEGVEEDNVYITEDGLTEIKINSDRMSGNDVADAYYAFKTVDMTASGQNMGSVVLKRPFGKIRLVATDNVDGSSTQFPTDTKVTYGSAITVPDTFNAMDGKATGSMSAGGYDFTVSQENALVKGETYENAYILGYDYIFASDAQPSYAFDIVINSNGEQIGMRNISNIPVVANKLTTVIGNFYSNEFSVDIVIDDFFDDEETFDPAPVEAMRSALMNGETYVLSNDMDITGAGITVPAGVESVLDLNGHTITAKNGSNGNIVVNGMLTLKDSGAEGKIVSGSDYAADYATGLVVVNGEDAKLVMEGGYIYAVREDAVNKGQFGVVVTDGGDFTMTGGKIEAGWYAVSGNGNDKTQNSVIAISGGELISTMDYAVYLPHSCVTTITGGIVNGAAGAVSIQRGELNIGGDAQILSDGTGNTGNWGDGTGNQPNCGIMAGARYGDCVINIDGGIFRAENNVFEKGESQYAVDVNVAAGQFSDPTLLAYLEKGADVNVVLEKDFEGPGLGIFKNGNGDSASIEIDLGGNEWILNDEPLFGSPGTVSQYFHLEKDATVVMKNGALRPLESSSATMLIQNYSMLTLENMVVEGGSSCSYVISNNNGECNIVNTEVTAAAGKVAFDVYSYSSYEGVTVTVSGTSVVNGNVEFGGDNNKTNGKLVISGGTFNGDFVVDEAYVMADGSNISITGGTFNGNGWDAYKN